MAVSSAQLKAQKLMQEFAVSRAGFFPGMPAGMAAPGLLGPLGGPAGPGPAGPMALVPVMLQNPDGTLTAAYQVQPVPPAGFATEGIPTELAGQSWRLRLSDHTSLDHSTCSLCEAA